MKLVLPKDTKRAWARRRLWLLTMELVLATLISWAVAIIAARNGQSSFITAGIAVCIVLLPLELARQLDIDIITRVRAALRYETRDVSWVQPILSAIEQAATQTSANNSALLQVGSTIEKYERAQIEEASRQNEALHKLLDVLNALREEVSLLPSRIAQANPISARFSAAHDRVKELIQLGEMDKAVKLLEVLRNENPEDAARMRYRQVLRRIALARNFSQIDESDKAAEQLREAQNTLDNLQTTLEIDSKVE